ncbi:flagellar protein FlaI [Halopenitus malekzadehii]|uniref:Flagellar protein FlaI n=1 Tax=Halopenitus malekzadehii TaxID=1267564 RepID=A0A1H6J0B2_9EURY|nr:ATPase, T2SS/T4P/T4SS family [Halopenitus malekzadehii]SEH55330.1 flagellar protein FlaI [Halopenitus malekzadehii]
MAEHADGEGEPSDAERGRGGTDTGDGAEIQPADLSARITVAAAAGKTLHDRCADRYDLSTVPVAKGYYTWADYAREYGLDGAGDASGTAGVGDADGDRDADGDESRDAEGVDRTAALGFDPDALDGLLSAGGALAEGLLAAVETRTVSIAEDLAEDDFFSTDEGATTLVNRYDLEKAVPAAKKSHFREVERYWVNKPYAFVIIFHSTKENEKKYYAIQPYRTEIESDINDYLTGKLRTSIKYADESIAGGDEAERKAVIAEETYRLLDRYDLYTRESDSSPIAEAFDRFGFEPTDGITGRIAQALGYEPRESRRQGDLDGIAARPEPAVLEEDAETLTEYQVEKLLYYLKRDFIGYERIDPIKYDINVEDISCDGYDSPVFVYHSGYEQIISNVHHGTTELDDFVVKLAQRSGKGISKRSPQVDCTLPDGSRAQLTLGKEVSDHGTNYTIRQFKDVPFTPVDLVNWNTFSLDEMAFLWLCIENHKSLIFAGGTASGKTTSLNAVSLFIPSNSKIVSIEDTREVELPQRNWIASVTRPSFSDDDKGDVDEFDLLEAALRQRPDYIVMGEIRGEEGRTAFQVMSTGHTTYTTFHADSVGEVLKRFTTDPINVSKTMFTALDLVSVQSSTRVKGRKVRRNKSLTEINHYDAENDEINVQDIYQWQAETDEFLQLGESNTLREITFDRGWDRETLEAEMFKRRVVLAYLIDCGLNTYAEVAATFQAFINDPETILALMANDGLRRSLEDLREMESVQINVDPATEAMVPRPEPDESGREEAAGILEDAEDLFAEYRGTVPNSVADAIVDVPAASDVEAEPAADRSTLRTIAADAGTGDDEIDAAEATAGDADADTSINPSVDGDVDADVGDERDPLDVESSETDQPRASGRSIDPVTEASTDPETEASTDPETEASSEPEAETDEQLSLRSPAPPMDDGSRDAPPDAADTESHEPTDRPPETDPGVRDGLTDGDTAEENARDGAKPAEQDEPTAEQDEPTAEQDESTVEIDEWGFGPIEDDGSGE